MHKLHKESTKYVKAESQAAIAYMLEPKLTEEEKTILKRGRNAKSGTVPKNAKIQDYKYATGFESLIGYLYLLRREDRIMEFFADIAEGGAIK
jgi:ribonuclease III family protein